MLRDRQTDRGTENYWQWALKTVANLIHTYICLWNVCEFKQIIYQPKWLLFILFKKQFVFQSVALLWGVADWHWGRGPETRSWGWIPPKLASNRGFTIYIWNLIISCKILNIIFIFIVKVIQQKTIYFCDYWYSWNLNTLCPQNTVIKTHVLTCNRYLHNRSSAFQKQLSAAKTTQWGESHKCPHCKEVGGTAWTAPPSGLADTVMFLNWADTCHSLLTGLSSEEPLLLPSLIH